ncbi:MAG TPA: DUF4197 domain-containing protein [Candidatus Sulfotelmatobacter sp.]|nr:DUF4197 domain-containing protein [Candidatus Sulfotelmatobacter sp.]
MRRCCLVVLAILLPPVAAHAEGSLLDRGEALLQKGSSSGANLSTGDIASGLKEALKVGTGRVVDTLGRVDGFAKSKDVHIPLPAALHTVQGALKKVGMSKMADDLELRLNRAAEAALPKAKQLFWNAIAAMSLDDARAIYNGPKDAATQYFKNKMSVPLANDMRPIVDRSLAEVGAVKSYEQMMARYKSIPLVPDAKADLTNYTLDKAIDAAFLYLGREEAAIRQDPAKQTTALLRKVFGH